MKRFVAALLAVALLFGVPALAQEEKEPLDLSSLSYAEVVLEKGKLNVRKKPDGKVQFMVPTGVIVMVKGDEGDWSEIVYNRKTGWAKNEFLNFEVDLGLEALKEGMTSRAVENLKYRLKELGYFRSTSDQFDQYFTRTMTDRIKLVQKELGLEETGEVSAALHAYLYYGPMKRFRGKLPPASYSPGAADVVSGTGSASASGFNGFTVTLTVTGGGNGTKTTKTDGTVTVTDALNIALTVTGGKSPYAEALQISAADGSANAVAARGSYSFTHPLTDADKALVQATVSDASGQTLRLVVTATITKK